jgi:hypothetical protein
MVKLDPVAGDGGKSSLIVVLNWFEELKRAAPPHSLEQSRAR